MVTKNLAELQNALQNFLLDKNQDASQLTMETPMFSRQERLQIYHDAYRLRLIDALRNDYPAFYALAGHDEFVVIANEFIALHPSQHTSLRWLGEKLPGFLRSHSHWKTQTPAIEIAQFEWAQIMAFDAADVACATLDDVRVLQPEQWMEMQLELHPSLQRLSCFTNAPQLWNSIMKEDQVIAPINSIESTHWLIWREDLQVVYRSLEKPEAWALDAFKRQQSFSDVCSGLCEWFAQEQVPMQAAHYLQQWIRSGLVTAIIAKSS